MTGILFSRLFGAAFVAALILSLASSAGRAASAAPADNCAAANAAVQAADTNASGLIDEAELAASRDQWQAGALARDDMDAISQAWIYQCPVESGKGGAPANPVEAGTLPGGVAPPRHVDAPGLNINANIYNDATGDNKFTQDDCALLHADLANKGVALTDLHYDFNNNGSVGPEDVKACEELVSQISTAPPAGPGDGEPAKLAESAKAGLTLSVERVTPSGGDVKALTAEPVDENLSCALDWGDKTSPAVITPQATRHETRHAYAATGNYTVTYQCRRPNGDILTRTAGISVDAVGPGQSASRFLTIFFVPFNYTDQNAAAADADKVAGWLKRNSPFKDFPDAGIRTVIAAGAFQCPAGQDHRSCDTIVAKTWANAPDTYAGRINLALGMCAPGTCLMALKQSGGYCTEVTSGVTYGLGRRISVFDLFSCQGQGGGELVTGERTALHEIGHALGLDHVRACQMPEKASVCQPDQNSAACRELTATFDDGVNAGDKNAANKERDYMTYCPTAADHYGPLGYDHIKSKLFFGARPILP